MHKIQALPLPPKALNLQGISPKQIEPHYSDLYLGYVNRINQIREMLREGADNPLVFRGLKVEETYNLDGVKLHEMYFYNLSRKGGKPDPALLEVLQDNFGSYNNWLQDFINTGMAARGWTVLAYDPRDNGLHHFLLDAHNVGVISDWIPLLVLDVYEHAYYIDFGTAKRAYIDAFINNIDWQVVNARFQGIGLSKPAISSEPEQNG